jgi:PKD repeat protein
MPLEPQFRKPIDAQWSFKVVDAEARIVAFKDQSEGQITVWKWDFGDGTVSSEQNPIHQYRDRPGREGNYTAILTVTGPAGTSHLAKVWGVHVRGSSPPAAVQ